MWPSQPPPILVTPVRPAKTACKIDSIPRSARLTGNKPFLLDIYEPVAGAGKQRADFAEQGTKYVYQGESRGGDRALICRVGEGRGSPAAAASVAQPPPILRIR